MWSCRMFIMDNLSFQSKQLSTLVFSNQPHLLSTLKQSGYSRETPKTSRTASRLLQRTDKQYITSRKLYSSNIFTLCFISTTGISAKSRYHYQEKPLTMMQINITGCLTVMTALLRQMDPLQPNSFSSADL